MAEINGNLFRVKIGTVAIGGRPHAASLFRKTFRKLPTRIQQETQPITRQPERSESKVRLMGFMILTMP